MPGAGISGKNGTVKISSTDIAEITKWTFNPKADLKSYASNKTAGYKRTVSGPKMGTGTLEGKIDPAAGPWTTIDAGTDVTLLLYINVAQYYSAPSVVEGPNMTIDIDAGEVESFSCNFSTNGAWTNPASSEVLEEPPPGGGGMFVPGKLHTDEAALQRTAQRAAAATAQKIGKRETAEIERLVEQAVGRLVPGLEARLVPLISKAVYDRVAVKAYARAA